MNGGNQSNPMQDAMMQGMFNQQAAQQQQKMNMMNQTTPYGSLTYASDPNSPSGYSANQSFSPAVQGVLDTNVANAQGMGTAQGQLLNNVNSQITQPLDLSYGANADRIAQMEQKTLDPQWQQNKETFDATMANRGLLPGSQAYNNASYNFNSAKNNAYDTMFNTAWNTANNAAQAQYNSPFNALASLRTGSQVAQPVSSMGLTSTPQESIQAPNYMGAMQSYNQQQQANQNAALGGMFGLGGNIISGVMGLL